MNWVSTKWVFIVHVLSAVELAYFLEEKNCTEFSRSLESHDWREVSVDPDQNFVSGRFPEVVSAPGRWLLFHQPSNQTLTC